MKYYANIANFQHPWVKNRTCQIVRANNLLNQKQIGHDTTVAAVALEQSKE